jgi:hypothetical protein
MSAWQRGSCVYVPLNGAGFNTLFILSVTKIHGTGD